MDLNNIEKLEELVATLVEELRRLKAENKTLQRNVEKYGKDLENALADSKKSGKQLDRLGKLEEAKKRLESDQSEVRGKVENILEELEKIDFL